MAEQAQAYAKLHGESFVYYMRTLSSLAPSAGVIAMLIALVTLGRRGGEGDDVDVDLGSSNKSISRLHARIVYDFTTRSFHLFSLGKNGVTVNGAHHPPNSDPVELETKYVCFQCDW